MICEDCKYWRVISETDSEYGACTVNPPEPDERNGNRAVWPITLAIEGCGFYEPKDFGDD